MTNREWLMNKMQNMSDEEFASYIRCTNELAGEIHKYKEKEEACSDISCECCLERWLKVEHKEQIKLTGSERFVLESINTEEYTFIGRDGLGRLFLTAWGYDQEKVYTISPKMFAFIQNNQVWNIETLKREVIKHEEI